MNHQLTCKYSLHSNDGSRNFKVHMKMNVWPIGNQTVTCWKGFGFSTHLGILMALLCLLLIPIPSYPVQTGVDLYVGEQNGGSDLHNGWVWTVDGQSASGNFKWECGYIIAGYIMRSYAHFDLDVKPDTAHFAAVTADSHICDAFSAIWPPSCYDVYINDPISGYGYRKNIWWPMWRTGYMSERFPNDPLYTSTSFGFGFYIDPNTNAEPAVDWVVQSETGATISKIPRKQHYPISNDGKSRALGTAINTDYMGTNYPVTFAIVGPDHGCWLDNLGDAAIFHASTNEGTVEVAALTDNPNPCLVTNFWFDVMSSECQSCASGGAACDVWTGVDSVNIKFNLGPSKQGKNAFLQVKADAPSPALGTPQSLQCNFVRMDMQVITDGQGWLRQVASLDRVVDIMANGTNSYLVSYYCPENILRVAGTNGFYQFTNAPFRTVLVSLVDGDTNHLQVLDSGSSSADYYWSNGAWTMTTGGGLRSETLTVATNGSTYTKTRGIRNGEGGIDHQSSETWENFSYGARLIQETAGTGPLARTETYTYNAGGMLQQADHSDGSWDIYHYDTMGRQVGHYTPFLNSAPTTNSALCRYTATTYDAGVVAGSGDVGSLDPYVPRRVVNYVLGQEIGRSYTVVLPGKQLDIQCPNSGAAWNDFSNLVTTTYLFQDAVNYGRPREIIHPDGTVQISSYEYGVGCPLPNPQPNTQDQTAYDKTTVKSGALGFTNVSGETVDIVVDGTKDETWTDSFERRRLHRVTDIASQVVLEQEKYYYDGQGHLTNTVYLNRSTLQQSYDCCHLESSVAPDGTVTSYGYDALKRRMLTVQNGITVSNSYNANGDVLGSYRYGTDGSVVTNNQSIYTDGGQLVASTDGMNHTTAYTNYFDGGGQLIKVTTYPDTTTRIETYARDGALLKVTGTSVLPVRYDYGVESEGGVQRFYRKEIKLDGNGDDTGEWTKTYTDMLGHEYKTVYASASGSPASRSYYNNNGQLIRQVDPDGVAMLYQYNAKGEAAYAAVDVNTNGVIDFGGNDRITYTVSDMVTNGYNLYAHRTRTYVWNTAGVNASNLVSTVMTAVDGMQSWSIVWHDGVGLTNHTETLLDPAHGTTTVVSMAPDHSATVSISVYGRPVSVVRQDSRGDQLGRVDYGYDAQGRQNTVTDARNGTSTSYFNAAGQVVAVRAPSPDGIQAGQLTTNILDALGRVTKTLLPDNTAVTNAYYPNGLLQTTYGSRTYPVAYTYDYAGRMKTMTTWTNFASSSGAAVTTWNYDGYRGFLTNKAYADGKGPSYTYTAAGRLQTRVWARLVGGQPLATTYGYDGAGNLATVSYSDSTPALGYAVDRLGRTLFVTNGTTVCAWTYNDLGQPLAESYTGGPLNGLSVTNGYDRYLRRTTLSLLASGSPLASTAYGYDYASRLSTVASGNNAAAYRYVANSTLVEQIGFYDNDALRMTTTKQYDHLNRLKAIASQATAPGLAPAAFDYDYNQANQRTSVTNADASHWVYQYDDLGQVVSGKRYWKDGTPVAGQQFTYDFDDIGNRQSTGSGGDASGNNLRRAGYTANNLNQYTSRDVPGYATVLGTANPQATVTVNLQRAIRQGGYFWDELAVDNSGGSLYLTLTNLAVLNNGTNADIVATNMGRLFVAQTPEVFSYDADGNLTNDGRWSYVWDAENRLLSLTSLESAPTASKVKLEFAYDHQFRRVQKIVSTNNGTGYVVVSTNRFVYDGWNLLAILNPQSSIHTSFTWGLDLSGSLQGAGGVGGLLLVTFHSSPVTNAFPAFDGNGNVSALVNANNGSTVASYEYDPFGQVIRMTGPLARFNPFRFSTKYQDDESGLNYYGYRYYDPNTGRWLSRDPIEEVGGINIYDCIQNTMVNSIDSLGLQFFGFNPTTGQYSGPLYDAHNMPPTTLEPSSPILPTGPAGTTSLLDGNNTDGNLVLGGAWSMFLYGIIAPPFAHPQISGELLNRAKQKIHKDQEMDLMRDVKKLLKCNNSGGITLVPRRQDFSIDPEAGRVHIGMWQLDLIGDMSWSCGLGKVVGSDCNCECKITGKFKAHFSKTWTFQPWGYNDLNPGVKPAWEVTLLTQKFLYGFASGKYYMSGDFEDEQTITVNHADKLIKNDK